MRRAVVAAACAAALLVPAAGASGASVSLRAKTHTVRVGSVRLGYREFGRGRPLVMVMGFAGTMDAWDPAFTDALARRHRVVLFDNRGVARSTGAPATITVPRMAADTAGLIRALHLGRPDVLGWSMGGFIAQSLAVRYPRSLRRLVLAATGPRAPRFTLPSLDVGAQLIAPGAGLAGLVEFLFPADQAAARDAWIKRVGRRGSFEQISAATLGGQRQAVLDWSTKPAASDNPRRIRARTLVGEGTEDHLIPAVNSRTLARAVRGARLKLYPDAAHAFLFQERASFEPLVERFLAAR